MTTTKIPGVTRGGNINGTHLCDYVNASFTQLRELLGEPEDIGKGDGKVSTEWDCLFEGKTFTVYDYKETSLYDRHYPSVKKFRAQPKYAWHIGGVDKDAAARFAVVLTEAIKKL